MLLTFSCPFLLVYQREFKHEESGTIQCYLGRTIRIVWVNYDSRKTECVSNSATKSMQEYCDGKTTCNFNIRRAEFLGSTSCSGDSNSFLVRHTCKVDAKPGKLKVRRSVCQLVYSSVNWSVVQFVCPVHKIIRILLSYF